MNLLVLGATGATGRVLVPMALAAGHTVTAVVRKRELLHIESPKLTVVEGSVMDAELMDQVVPSQQAVISILGTRRGPSGFGSFKLMSRTMDALLPALQRHKVPRLILLSALGVGESADIAPPFLRIIFQTVFRPVGQDKASSEDHIRRSGLDWTIVYAPVLTNGAEVGAYQHGAQLQINGLRRLSRADLARFLLDQTEDPTYIGKNVVVSS
jgi:putative NADH-flavin reductase